MIKMYYFGIQNSRVGPLDEKAITSRINEGSINRETLAWCEGMDNWRPVHQIPELMSAFGTFLKTAEPPPLPAGQAVPPLSVPGLQGFKNSGSLSDQAYRFVAWCYRPWRGRPSPLRRWVDGDPKKRALPVAVGTVAMMVLIPILWISSIKENKQAIQNAALQTEQMGQMGMSSQADLMARQRAWQDAHRYTQDVIDDSYRYRRDSQDRMDETYRRGTYDWYGKDDN